MFVNRKRKIVGVTLIEMLLVMTIISFFIYASVGYFQQKNLQLSVQKVSAQIQALLTDAQAYYVANNMWPTGLQCLLGVGTVANPPCSVAYFGPSIAYPPWLSGYDSTSNSSTFTVIAIINAGKLGPSIAKLIAGKLPLAYIVNDYPTLYVYAMTNIPAQNLNNATAISYAGVYHHGACVPVPQCPVDANGTTMKPEIMVIPVSVTGVNQPNSTSVNEINNFTAYALSNTGPGNVPTNSRPGDCNSGTYSTGSSNDCLELPNNGPSVTAYWRVCLSINTPAGSVASTNNPSNKSTSFPYEPWGGDVTLLAITRCAMTNEPAGSTLNVYSR